MIFVNSTRTWPQVLAGHISAEDSVMGNWAALSEAKLHQYADAVVGVAAGTVVAVFDVANWSTVEDNRVRFYGAPSTRWAHLVGSPSPITWTRGQARPVRYVPTDEIAAASPGPGAEPVPTTRDRVSARGWSLQVDAEGHAVLYAPPGGRVTVIPSPIAAPDGADGQTSSPQG